MSKIWSAIIILHVAISIGPNALANPSLCMNLFGPSHHFEIDTRYRQIPIHSVGYQRYTYSPPNMGYEFLRGRPIFQDPEGLRQFINALPARPSNAAEFSGRGTLIVTASKLRLPNARAFLEEVAAATYGRLPNPADGELLAHVKAVLNDADKRAINPQKIIIQIRTELSELTVYDGHNHGGAEGLNWSNAEIGGNTEVDRLGQFQPMSLEKVEYVTSRDRETTLVFGNVWHRTPALLVLYPAGHSEAKRLYVIVSIE